MSLSTSSKHLLNTSRDGDSTTSLGSLFQCLITLSVKKNFLISSLNVPLVQLEAISFCPITCYLGEETDPHLSTTSFQVVVESNKVSPQPPLLQAKQPQFPQPLLIKLLLQTLHQLRCPSLDTLQHLNVSLVVGGPNLNTVFKMRPPQCRVQGHDHFPTPAGHTISDTSQDAVGFLGHLGTLPAHVQVTVNQHSQVLFCQAAFQPLFPKPVALHGVAVTQVQDLALGLVKPHTVDLGPSIQPVQSLPTLKQINTPTQLGVICKLTEGALSSLIQIIDKDIKQNWPQHRALGNTACDRLPTGVNSIHHHSLGPAIQPVLYPAKSTPVQAMSSQFLQENASEYSGPRILCIPSPKTLGVNLESPLVLSARGSRNLFCCVAPCDDVINVLQVFWSFTLFQCSLDQSMANGRAVSPPLGQWIPVHIEVLARPARQHSATSTNQFIDGNQGVWVDMILPPVHCCGSNWHLLFFDPQQSHIRERPLRDQVITANELAYDTGALHTNFRHTGHESPPEAEDLCPFSNRFVNAPFPRKGSSCLASLPSNSRLLAPLSQHQSSQPVPMLDNPLGEEKFPNIQSKPPLAQLEAISSCPITCYLGEETDPHLSTTSFQVVEESDKVSPQPPFLQAKQSQLPQPLLIKLLLQTLHQLRCPSLDTLQHLSVSLVVGGPKLNTGFEVQPHQCRVQGHDHFPTPAGHAIPDTSQDAIGFLGHLGTLLAHIQAAVNKHPQVLLCQAAFQPLFPKPVALHGVAVAQ
ncbi:hypothetical protein QYF61_008059, partial [Mycteria americana]